MKIRCADRAFTWFTPETTAFSNNPLGLTAATLQRICNAAATLKGFCKYLGGLGKLPSATLQR